MSATTAEAQTLPLAPELPGAPLVGVLPEIRRDRLALFLRAARAGDVVRLRFPGLTGVLVNRPELIKHVLVDDYRAFGKQTRGYNALRIALGDGLVTSEGELWRRQRRIAQPAFHKRRIAGFADRMGAATRDMLAAWEPRCDRGETIDVAEDIMTLTLRIVGECLMGTDLTDEAGRVGPAVTALLREVIRRITAPVSFPLAVPTPKNRLLQRHLRELDDVVLRIIADRRKNGAASDDLLQMLLEATDEETGERMSDKQLRDEILTLVLAGHETTATALTWTLYLLSRHPDIDRRLAEERREASLGEAIEVDDLKRLPLLEAVIKESMRLYPPVWMLARSVAEDQALGGFRIAAGSVVFVIPYVIHRDARWWPNPEGFDPDRFLPPRGDDIPRCTYIPFLTGPRKCIGDAFAMMEAQVLLHLILSKFELHVQAGYVPRPEPVVTLRPDGGMPMRLRRRQA